MITDRNQCSSEDKNKTKCKSHMLTFILDKTDIYIQALTFWHASPYCNIYNHTRSLNSFLQSKILKSCSKHLSVQFLSFKQNSESNERTSKHIDATSWQKANLARKTRLPQNCLFDYLTRTQPPPPAGLLQVDTAQNDNC